MLKSVDRTSASRVTVTRELQRRLAADYAAYSLTRPSWIIVWIVFAIATALSILAGALTAVAAGDAPWESIIAVALVAAMTIAIVVTTRVQASRALRTMYPVGSVIIADLGERALAIITPLATQRIDYSLFRRLVLHGETALLRVRRSSGAVVLPAALFADDEIDFLHERCGG